MTDFIKRIEQTKYLIASFAKDPTPSRTPYTLHRYESYPFRPVYIERSHNSQLFQQYNNKTHNVRFPSRIHKKDINGKNKNIDRTNQSKPWKADKDVNKDTCTYAMHSDDEDFYTSQPSSSIRFQTSVDKVYFVQDSIQSFDSGCYKFGYNKTFRSLEIKTIYIIKRAFQTSKQRIYRNPKKVDVILFFYSHPNLYRNNSLYSRNFHCSSYRFLSKRYNKRAVTFNSRRFDKYKKLYLYKDQDLHCL